MRDALHARVAALIDACADGARDDVTRDALLADLAAWQADRVEPYRRLVASRGVPPDAVAMPTDVFRHVRVAAHPPSEDVRVFRTSGTTSGARGAHPLRDLSLYDRAARSAARHALFTGVDRMHLVVLAPSPAEAPDSSLSYMLGRFAEWFGARVDWVFPIDDRLARALEPATEPVALLGTSFAFVHAEDRLDRRFALPPGSRVMQTGGFKGRSREVEPAALRAAISARYGVPQTHIVAEYSMTELSSQLYEATLLGAVDRGLWVPGWVRATVVDPETLAPVPAGQTGILRLDDPANLDTVSAIQTADLAIARGDAIELLGRAPGAAPRGCSLAVEEALG